MYFLRSCIQEIDVKDTEKEKAVINRLIQWAGK